MADYDSIMDKLKDPTEKDPTEKEPADKNLVKQLRLYGLPAES